SVGTAGVIVGTLVAAGLLAAWHLQLDLREIWPAHRSWAPAREFFIAAARPAVQFQGTYQGSGAHSLLAQAMQAAVLTVVFAATSLSIALVGGVALGFLSSVSLMGGGRGRSVVVVVRLISSLLRSVHELIWAVVLLAALGYSHLVAVVAIAIPYAGTLAKVFSEVMDEAPRDAAQALELSGANPLQRFAWGVLPRALPDMIAYTYYRFECALRSSAVLGFFGFPTLGYHIAASFENLYYNEVWTYLYVLLSLVLLVEWWSSRLRRELVS
ncbi:MAG: phosphonate transport system permease protein, partial [Candidatus Krumholzibacteriia bacterium]